SVKMDFNTENPDEVGQSFTIPLNVQNDNISVETNGSTENWKRIDNGNGTLAGIWRSGGRVENGAVAFNPPGARKTFKVLSGSRFQWTAFNTDTKEMIATGGGTYSFVNGKYTENIEFFSRDSSRVGISLHFDDKVENDNWYHTGQTSK